MQLTISEHAMQRYAERFLGVHKQDVKEYVEQNNHSLANHICRLFCESDLLLAGYAPSRNECLDYYVNGEWMLVVQAHKKEVYTVIRLAFSEDKRENQRIIGRYTKEIRNKSSFVQSAKRELALQNDESAKLEYLLQRGNEYLPDKEKESLVAELNESIEKCKELAKKEKELRMEIRDLMDDWFKKSRKAVSS